MTVTGTVNRAFVLFALLLAGAGGAWWYLTGGGNALIEARLQAASGMIAAGAIGGLILALITVFSRSSAPITAPLYAVAEGVFLGALSTLLNERYPGIPMQAAAMTLAILFTMLTCYRTGLIKVTGKLKAVIASATAAVFLFYMARLLLGFFGVGLFDSVVNGSSGLAIGFSVVIVLIAAFNLLLDFDLIERGAAAGAPKYMEWYAAFALLVTLVWLYLEILRLLLKLTRRR